jgi:hypothetical protein
MVVRCDTILWSIRIVKESETTREKTKKMRRLFLALYLVEHVGPRLQFCLAPFLKSSERRRKRAIASERIKGA